MLAEDLSLVEVVVGPRGSGKTLLLTHFITESLARAWALLKLRKAKGNPLLYPRKKVNIWSNFPVKSLWKPPGNGRAILLSSQDLDIEKLITWHPDFKDGIIFFDEIDQAADKQDWMAVLPKLLVKGIKLMRHRNLTLCGSLQFIDELNARLYKQADIVIQNRDLAFTPWGREQHLRPGEVSETIWIDKSGIMTGYAYNETHQTYPLQFFGKRYWGSYATHHDFDIWTPKYKLNNEVREISSISQLEEQEKNKQAVFTAIYYFVYERPGEKIKSTEFHEKLNEFGCAWTPHVWGKFLINIGVKSTKYQGVSRYDFSNIELDKVAI